MKIYLIVIELCNLSRSQLELTDKQTNGVVKNLPPLPVAELINVWFEASVN